ncbi:MAG TPA: biotin/lipoyl-containing protein [Thermoleophilaceae bacterium]|jgi:acetyl-CoA carboxylase biotin carboxyl carrier protein
MALSDEDVKEILRLIDESDLDELLIETDGFKLHVLRNSSQLPVPSSQPQPAEPANRQPPTANGATIDAPMLGTFYRAEAPGAAPFVDVGATVEPDTIVCLIEVMKMMNSIPAGVAGTIVEVCADNAALVEYGQPLFRVEPA